MRNHVLRLGVMAAALWPLVAVAQSASPPKASCSPLQLLNEVPLKFAADGTTLVPVKVNGQETDFILFTGGNRTMIGADLVAQYNISKGRLGDAEYFVDSTGQTSRDAVRLSSFELGRLKGGASTLPVVSMRGNGAGGALALNYLISYDLDLDFGAARMRQFSQDHCPGKVMYWQAPVLGRVALERSDTIHVRVELDGHPMVAAINTATAQSAIGIETAEKIFHLDAAAWGEGKGPIGNIRTRAFEKLAFGDVQVRNLHLALNPRRTLSRGGMFADLMIGTDILRKLHVYFAFKEQTMYVSPASEPGPASAATEPAAASAPVAVQ